MVELNKLHEGERKSSYSHIARERESAAMKRIRVEKEQDRRSMSTWRGKKARLRIFPSSSSIHLRFSMD